MDKLPEKWCITTTEESNDELVKWFAEYLYYENADTIDKTVGNHFCMNDRELNGWMSHAPENKKGYVEINYKQFKKFVLKHVEKPKNYNYLIPLFKKLKII